MQAIPVTPQTIAVYFTATRSSQPQRRGRPVVVPNSRPSFPDLLADRIIEFGREGAAADSGRVRLHDPEHSVDPSQWNAGAGRNSKGGAVRAGDEGIRPVVDVEQAGVGAFEEDASSIRQRVVQVPGGVGDVGGKAFTLGQGLIEKPRDVHRLGVCGSEGSELGLTQFAGQFKFGSEAILVGEIADANGRGAKDLVRICRPDASAGGADRIATIARHEFLEGSVEGLVIGHHHVGPAGESKVGVDLDVAGSKAIDLLEKLGRIDHHAIADDAGAAGKQNSGWHQMEGVPLVADHHRVARVRAAVVSDDAIMVRSEKVDELALSFVTPIGGPTIAVWPPLWAKGEGFSEWSWGGVGMDSPAGASVYDARKPSWVFEMPRIAGSGFRMLHGRSICPESASVRRPEEVPGERTTGHSNHVSESWLPAGAGGPGSCSWKIGPLPVVWHEYPDSGDA